MLNETFSVIFKHGVVGTRDNSSEDLLTYRINSIHARTAKNNLTKQTNREKRNYTLCLKLIEKVSFNIASEASYVYILSGQKFSKKRQKWSILTSF